MKLNNLRYVAIVAALLLSASLPLARGQYIQWSDANRGLDLGSGRGVIEVATGGKAPAYAIVDGVGIYSSSDLGATWQKLAGDAPPLQTPYSIAIAPDAGNTVYASVAAAGGGLWQSADAGKTWTQIGSQKKGMASDDVEWITIHAAKPNLIVVGHRDGSKLSVSNDAGATWVARDIGVSVKNAVPFIIDENRWVIASREGKELQEAGTKTLRYTENAGETWADPEGDGTSYFAGPLPVIQSGQTLLSVRHHGFSRSTDGGKSWKYIMEGHTRVLGSAGGYIFRESDRPHTSKDNRSLAVAMSSDFFQTQELVNFNLLNVIPEKLRPTVIIPASVDPFAHLRIATCWASTPDAQTVFLGLGKAGLYSGRLLFTPKGPRMATASIAPISLPEKDNTTRVVINVSASSRNGMIKKVWADLSGLNAGALELFDDGKHSDAQAGDKIYGNTFAVPKGTLATTASIGIVAEADDGTLTSMSVDFKIASNTQKLIVWDGDAVAPRAQGWYAPHDAEHAFNTLGPTQDEAHNGKVSLELHSESGGFSGGGWNWHGFYPADAGTDVRTFSNIYFWAKTVGSKKPGSFSVALVSNNGKSTEPADVGGYVEHWDDGEWHEVVIPLKDLIGNGKNEFNPAKAWMLNINTWSPLAVNFSIYIDEIGFDNRITRSRKEWVTAAEPRDPGALGAAVAHVTVDVDTKSPGKPISPFIYGAAMGDRTLGAECGLTMLRAGGNPVTPLNWKTGFSSNGADWFYTNNGKLTDPSNNWLVTAHGLNKAANLETYLTIPIMGRVAKDSESAAFSIDKYPDQTDWAGRQQPTDPHPKAGSGIRFVKDSSGQVKKDAKGNPVTESIVADPNDTSIEVSPEEQTGILPYLINDMNYGTADKGGVKVVALDNEPGIWHGTHRGMHPHGMSYDELWDKTLKCATLLKKADPSVKIAGPTAWGWSEYYYSGQDAELCASGQASWDHPPDFEKHGRVPLSKWYLQQIAKYEKEHGTRLVDILDWHFYPQNGLYLGGKDGDPATMETRAQETRVLWDPDFVDPSWMGRETGNKIQLIRLMKQWIAESNPGMQISIGEYNFGGDKDPSGAVAEAEVLGIFAREGVDYAFMWYFPAPNSSQYFAYKMFRNPDGQHTVFGDQYLSSANNSAPTDVSVHCARDSKSGKLTFVLVNKRVAKGAKVTLNLSAPVPAQSLTAYEYGPADRFAIGQLPARNVSGSKIDIDLPPMSVVRFDLKP